MFGQVGAFLKGFVKVAKNAAVRAANEWAGKPVHTLMLEGVCVYTDDMWDALWKWFRERFAQPGERRAALEEFQNTPPAALKEQIEREIRQELPHAAPEQKQTLLELAEHAQANLLVHAEPPNERGQSLLKPDVRMETREQFVSLLTGQPAPAAGDRAADGLSGAPVAIAGGPVVEVVLQSGAALRPGNVLNGRYRVIRLLGQGGMGAVYLVEDDEFKDQAALKTIRPDASGDADLLARLREEAKVCRKLTHSHIVRVHDVLAFGYGEKLYGLTMEFVPGQTLARWLAGRPNGATLDEFRAIAAALCEALDYAHRRGVLHNDIKPGNVMLGDDLREIKLMDFGLARAVRPGAQTLTRAAGYTVYYVAPEVLHGGQSSARSDLYALAVVCYELLTGQLPVAGAGPVAEERPDVPAALSDAIQKAMRKKPEQRFESVSAFHEALRTAWTPTAEPLVRESFLAPPPAGIPSRGSQEREGIPAKSGDEKGFSSQQAAAAPPPAKPAPAAAPPKPLTLDLGDGVKMELVRVPAGEFRMGSPESEEGRSDNEMQHRVKISRPFYLGRHPVTIAQFRQFVDETGYCTEAEKGSQEIEKGKKGGYFYYEGTPLWNERITWRNPGFAQGDDHPVTLVSWNDATAFCGWLAKKIGQPVRLPTEAEWEYACRAGTTTPFHFGTIISTDQANYNGNSFYGSGGYGKYREETTPVNSFPENSWGLQDMHGNVWEWCQDWYPGGYPFGTVVDPIGPETGPFHVRRGGSWYFPPAKCRAAKRDWNSPANRGCDTGFRVTVGPVELCGLD